MLVGWPPKVPVSTPQLNQRGCAGKCGQKGVGCYCDIICTQRVFQTFRFPLFLLLPATLFFFLLSISVSPFISISMSHFVSLFLLTHAHTHTHSVPFSPNSYTHRVIAAPTLQLNVPVRALFFQNSILCSSFLCDCLHTPWLYLLGGVFPHQQWNSCRDRCHERTPAASRLSQSPPAPRPSTRHPLTLM